MITMNTRWEPKKTKQKKNTKKFKTQWKENRKTIQDITVTVNVHHGPCQTSIHTILFRQHIIIMIMIILDKEKKKKRFAINRTTKQLCMNKYNLILSVGFLDENHGKKNLKEKKRNSHNTRNLKHNQYMYVYVWLYIIII